MAAKTPPRRQITKTPKITALTPDLPAGASPLPQRKRRSASDPRDVSRVAELPVNARRPVIYAGQGVLYEDSTLYQYQTRQVLPCRLRRLAP